jgi:hypothetical protein
MSDTPETDKAKIAFTSLFANDDAYWVPFKVSCKLERERDEALSDLEFRRDLFKLQEQQLNDVRAERDEARETAERYRLEANAMMMQRDTLSEAARTLPAYDSGILNDFGGGYVEWWQDYLRAEIGRANDYWRAALAAVKGGSDD